jgi:hypothetical protein
MKASMPSNAAATTVGHIRLVSDCADFIETSSGVGLRGYTFPMMLLEGRRPVAALGTNARILQSCERSGDQRSREHRESTQTADRPNAIAASQLISGSSVRT